MEHFDVVWKHGLAIGMPPHVPSLSDFRYAYVLCNTGDTVSALCADLLHQLCWCLLNFQLSWSCRNAADSTSGHLMRVVVLLNQVCSNIPVP